MKVRTHRDPRAGLCIMAGQRDVTFVQGPITPLQRYWSGGDAVALPLPGADLVHTVNAIPLVMPPRLIITFEERGQKIFPADTAPVVKA